MRFSALPCALALLASLVTVSAAPEAHRAQNLHRRVEHGKRAPSPKPTPEPATHQLERRFSNSRFTFFEDGLGACGKTNGPNDFIVALNSAQYAGGSHCFEMITITYNGKTTQAQITDECPSCDFGQLDFSKGLFDFFSDEGAGEIFGTWDFGSGSQPTTSSKPPPTTTSSTPKPTSTSTSTTSTSTSTSKTSTSTTNSSTSTSTSTSTSATSTSTTATATVSLLPTSASDPENIQQMMLAMVQIGDLISSGSQS